MKYIEESEYSSSSEEESGSDYSDSSFSREEREDKTILTKQPLEEFKAYKEESLLDSRPIFERKVHRKSSIPKKLRLNEKERSGEVFDITPDRLQKQKKMLKEPDLTRKRSATEKYNYDPHESKEYMNEILKSINNKNHLFLNPKYDSIFHGESMKIGKSIYVSSQGKKSIVNTFPQRQIPLRAVSLIQDGESEEDVSDPEISPFFEQAEESRFLRPEYRGSNLPLPADEFNAIGNSYCILDDVSENFSKINILPLAPEFKNVKNPQFFEEFYIVGVENMSLMSINSDQEIVRPSVLHIYPNTEEHEERHRIIKDFCFPTGVKIERIDLSKPDLDFEISDVSNFNNYF